MLNRVTLVGRLGRDPELRTTTTGKSVVEFSIAVTKRFKTPEGQDADWFRVQAWGTTAEFVSNYLTKGRLVSVDGRLQTRKWTANDGSTREVIEIVADNVESLDRPRDDYQPKQAQQATAVEEYDPFAD
jgi:single-strand DNA-binding protein